MFNLCNMIFSYGSNSTSEPHPNKETKTINQYMLPNSKPWVMCIGENNSEYYMNIFTHKITDKKPFYFQEYDKRIATEINTPIVTELERELELLQRKLHIIECKEYEEAYQNTTDNIFPINPAYTYEKGDTVWYIPNEKDPLIKSTVVAVHHDKPPFYSIRYTLPNGEIIEKNTTAPKIKR